MVLITRREFVRDKRQTWTENGMTYSQYGWKRDRACPKHGESQFSFADLPDSWYGCVGCREDQEAYDHMCCTNR
jgi:hypothetical protein